MPVLRSGKISSPSPSHKTVDRKKTRSTPPPPVEPNTPDKTGSTPPSGPTRRRSLRLSSSDFTPTPKRSRKDGADEKTVLPLGKSPTSIALDNNDIVSVNDNDSFRICDVELDDNVRKLGQNNQEFGGVRVLSLRSDAKVVKRLSIGGDSDDGSVKELGRNDGINRELEQNEGIDEENGGNECLSLRSGSRVVKRVSIGGIDDDGDGIVEEKGKRVFSVGDQGDVYRVEEDDDGLCSIKGEEGLMSPRSYVREEMGKSDFVVDDHGVMYSSLFLGPRKYTRGEKGKGVASNDDIREERNPWDEIVVRSPRRPVCYAKGESKLTVDDRGVAHIVNQDYSGRYTWEEKGKGVASSDDAVIGGNVDYNMETLESELGLDYSSLDLNFDVETDQGVNLGGEINEGDNNVKDGIPSSNQKNLREVHRNIARRNAFKYAHFSVDENEEGGGEQEDGEDLEGEDEVPEGDSGLNVEDWPGPFSTAMKIIRDREKNMGGKAKNSCSSAGGMPLISWTPRNEKGPVRKSRTASSLQNMCLKVLSENVDAIGSLNCVPDVLRHKLCQRLCDSRKMNAHFFSLLLEGSPSEIRVADCSWLEEEEFECSIKACDTKNLTVLQLDLCGQCISDSSLLKAVAQKGLPVLTTISLKGACRISDIGLTALVSAAPVLRSMNLSQCSLLTDVGIKTIADSLGSIVHELYLDDCDTLDAKSILPSLQKLVKLEVLSLRGISSVSDKFIKKFIKSNGHNMKELVLANCVNLSDSSLKVISETCSQLCVLDLSYLRKLTDVGMAYLANGCRGIQDLRLCRNAFSDDAIAAFLEASGEFLKELSLNNITKVGQNTTISLARRCKNLVSLDLSWCRSLPDEALGLIADSCVSLRLLKIFGCTQITNTFIDGHSNPELHIVGMKLTPLLEHIKRPDFQQGPLYYSAVPSF